MPDLDMVVKGLGLAALHLHNIAQRGGSLFKALIPQDAECCVEAIELLKAQEIQISDLQKVQPWIVRCNDCKYAEDCVSPYKEGEKWCMKMDAWTPKEWFCADGERKEGR